MVTSWRSIKSPWVGKNISYANIDRKNDCTKKASEININSSSSSITLTLATKQLRFIRLPRINVFNCHWVVVFSQQAFWSHETSNRSNSTIQKDLLFVFTGDVLLVRFLLIYVTLRFGVGLYLLKMINSLYSSQSFADFIQLSNAGRPFVKPLFNNDPWDKNFFLTKESTFIAQVIR